MKRKYYLLAIPAVLLLLVLLSVLSNLFMPRASTVVTHLSETDKALLAEALHLRRLRGDTVWPGFGGEALPVVVYNEAYAFLVNYEGVPPAGWVEPRHDVQQGTSWQLVADDTFFGTPYYRQPLQDGVTPQSFTVRLGDQWAASLMTYQWMHISLAQMLQEEMPALLRPIVPYRLATGLLLGSGDKYIALLGHESFHAFTGLQAGEHLVAAEKSTRQEGNYPWTDEALIAAWQAELELLQAALQADESEEAAALAQRFLHQREERHNEARLSAELIDYEQRREWLEGLAKYVELELWREGSTAGYTPHPATENLDDFHAYRDFDTAWKREVQQITRMADDEGDGRFYYSGMAQAELLDRLAPGWKQGALSGSATLDGLLEAALNERPLLVYFGNSQLDPAADCQAVFPVTRTVAAGVEPVTAALQQLLAGPTAGESIAGYHSWFSAETADTLRSVNIQEESVYINFADLRPLIPNASTSCGSASFFAQVEKTVAAAKPDVRHVYYALEGQPDLFYDWVGIGCVPGALRCDATQFVP